MRKACLTIGVAATAMLATFTPAQAGQLEVADESDHCSQMENTSHVITGGCIIHGITDENMVFRGHVPGMGEVAFFNCTNEFDARIQEDGTGFIYNQHMEGGSCLVAPCAEPSGPQVPWPFHMVEIAGGEILFMTFCFASNSTCSMSASIVADDVHDYELRTAGQRCSQSSALSITAHWNIEGTPIELAH